MNHGMKFNEQRKREYYAKGCWSSRTLLDFWDQSARRTPGKTAVVDSLGTRMTYAEVDAAAGRFAAWLRSVGVAPGDIVSSQLPGWAEFTVTYIACLKIGAVINPILPYNRFKELRYILNKCASKVLLIPGVFRDYDHVRMAACLADCVPALEQVVVVEKGLLRPAVPESTVRISDYDSLLADREPLAQAARTDADDLAVVLFTSGTESFPKGVMLTHNNVVSAIQSMAAALDLGERDVMLMPAPVGHATGFHHGVTTPFLLGGTSVLLDKFTADRALSLIEREHCTYTMGSATLIRDMFKELKERSYNLSSVRFFLCGGSPAPRHLFENALGMGFTVLSVYGSTESVPHSVSSPDAPADLLLTTDGRPVPNVEVRVVDEHRNPMPAGREGEEASRGPNVFMGYLNEPELTDTILDDDGWYYSGDLCTLDAEENLRITGRKKDIIIRGGENISCTELESILLRHPKIRDAAVVAMPDARMGEKACAYVSLEHPEDTLNLAELLQFFSCYGVAKLKTPERLEIVPEIPRNPAGKIQKFKLRKDIKMKICKEACEWNDCYQLSFPVVAD